MRILNFLFTDIIKRVITVTKRIILLLINQRKNTKICNICGDILEYPDYKVVNNFRETTICKSCGANRRHNDMALVLLTEMRIKKLYLSKAKKQIYKNKVYLLESYGPIFNVFSDSPNFVCSEYWDNVPNGQIVNGVYCEDVRKLTFNGNSFDFIISQDVFEHIPNPEEGFREIYRVLKPGGYHIFTVPFSRKMNKSRTRAIVINGQTKHILPPTYHGDILRREGILVYTDFGQDLLEILLKIGFQTKVFEDERSEYDGGYNIVFSCKKT
jgi:SAM-dependent methyltransferase